MRPQKTEGKCLCEVASFEGSAAVEQHDEERIEVSAEAVQEEAM